MSQVFPQLESVRVTMDAAAKDRHLDAVRAAIREQRAPRLRRLRLMAVALALVLMVPVLALAAERSVPGDLLYPVKRLVEPLVGVVDSEIEAEHRVEEVEILLERDAPAHIIRDHADVARETVSGDHPELSDRIDRVATDLRERESPDSETPAGADESSRTGTDDSGPTRTEERDTSTTTGRDTDTTQHRDRSGDG